MDVNGEDDRIEEVRRRVWWTCYKTDVLNIASFDITRYVSDMSPPPLSMEAEDFKQLLRGQRSAYGQEKAFGLWACSGKLMPILDRIQDLNQSLLHGQISASSVQHSVLQIAELLDHFTPTLLEHLQLIDDILKVHAE
jgi:hypothetical protein